MKVDLDLKLQVKALVSKENTNTPYIAAKNQANLLLSIYLLHAKFSGITEFSDYDLRAADDELEDFPLVKEEDPLRKKYASVATPMNFAEVTKKVQIEGYALVLIIKPAKRNFIS